MAKHRVPRDPVVQPQDQTIKLVALTKGQVTTIDAIEYARVMEINWHSLWNKSTKTYYARASHAGQLLHRFILGITDPKIEVDHWNGDSLDNRRENLRIVNRSQNRQNRGAYKNSKSGQAGVVWHKRDEKWEAYINAFGKRISLGYFKEKQPAIDRRKAAEIEHYGEFAIATRKPKH
jgi:hypothetical protein